jgi:hypothetical protein
VNCNAWRFVNDPVAGTQVLDSIFQGSWADGTHDFTMITTALNDGSQATEYPMSYMEFDTRSNYPNGASAGWSDWTHTIDGQNQNPKLPALETDIIQAAGTNGCNAAIDWWGTSRGSGYGLVGVCNVDLTQYHKYGLLWTGSASAWHFCFYVDDQQQGCTDYTPNAAQATERNFLIVWQQMTCGAGDFDGTCLGNQTMHLYTKTVRVWSCANWQNSMCYTQ